MTTQTQVASQRPVFTRAAALPVSMQPDVAMSPLQSMASAIGILFVYLMYSRLNEFLPVPKLIFLLGFGALAFIFASGRLPVVLQTRSGILLAAFTGWIVITIPFAFWKTGTIMVLREQWLRAILTFVIIVGAPVVFPQARRLYTAMGLGACTVALLTLNSAQVAVDGRMAAESETSLGNPNAVAEYLLMGMPFCWYFLVRSKALLFRIAGLMVLPVALYLVVRTASRGALLTMCIIALYVFVKASNAQKVALVSLVAVGATAVVSMMPSSAFDRYRTLFSDEAAAASATAASAEESTRSRKEMLMDSIWLTLSNPLFGVGAGNFAAAESHDKKLAGERPSWLRTHNTYTQLSSETGIPGLLIMLIAIVSCFRATSRMRDQLIAFGDSQSKTIADMARTLRLSWIAFMVLATFNHIAYSIFLPMLMGLTEVMIASASRHLTQLQQSRQRIAA